MQLVEMEPGTVWNRNTHAAQVVISFIWGVDYMLNSDHNL